MLQNTKFEVNTEKFTGPLHKLLELIQEKKVDINQLGLASITEDFLSYLESLKKIEPSVLADFVATAAKLILIKSKTLLPSIELSQEEEEDIADLEIRLEIYRNFAAKIKGQKDNASTIIQRLYDSKRRSFSRSMLQSISHQPLFYPAENLSISTLNTSLRKILLSLEDLLPKKSNIKIKTISLQEKMEELKAKLELAVNSSFNSLSQSKSKQEIIVLFLAMLHLFANKLLDLEQEGQFGEIRISKK